MDIVLLFVEKVHIMNHPLSILTDGVLQNNPAYWTNIMPFPMKRNRIYQSRIALWIFANKSLSDFGISVILSTIYICKEKIGRVKYHAIPKRIYPLRPRFPYRGKTALSSGIVFPFALNPATVQCNQQRLFSQYVPLLQATQGNMVYFSNSLRKSSRYSFCCRFR